MTHAHHTAQPWHARSATRWLAVALLCATAGCIEPTLVLCSNGLACPVSERCDEIHHTCVLPDQLVVCHGIADGTDCVTGPVSGGCFDGVCLPRGCGNRAVEPSEMCDDGNQIAGDGCSEDCGSTERCGNGFVDPDEPCDDGDLVSRDGCDSRCQVEEAGWSEIAGIAPDLIDARYTAYDATRDRLVYARHEGTWEWDGARWAFFALPAQGGIGFDAVFYDPEHQQVRMIGTDALAVVHLYAWIDGQWIAADSGNGPDYLGHEPEITAVYDAARHRVLAIEGRTSAMWAIDETGLWSDLPSFPGTAPPSAVVFDPVSSQVVVEATDSTEWVLDDDGWTSSATSFSPRVSVAFDPERGRVVLVDNELLGTYERIGTEWHAIENAEVPCLNKSFFGSLPLYYEHRGEALTLVGTRAWEICRWNDAWTASRTPVPFHPIGVTYDRLTRAFVVLHNTRPEDPDSPTEAWTFGNGSWHQIETLEMPWGRTNPLAIYSPGRGATVFYGEQPPPLPPEGEPTIFPCWDPVDYEADTWSFDGSSWTWLASLSRRGTPCSSSAATYDPSQGRVLLATYDELWSLGDTDAEWIRVGATSTGGHVFDVAWDARNNTAVAARGTEDISSPLFELRDGDWVPLEVIPNGISATTNALISDPRAGTVILIDNNFGRTYERSGPEWIRLPNAPVRSLFASWTAYDPSNGTVLLLGRASGGSFLTSLTRTSATPLESCQPGDDLDGDGLAGCDDPDCDWACPPPAHAP
jgi:cysteine-rich repeat protein